MIFEGSRYTHCSRR